MSLNQNAIKVLEKRYFIRDENGQPMENAEGMFRRVAKAVAKADAEFVSKAELAQMEEDFYNMMVNLEFLPNSPTLMNAGRPLGQLSACFVLPIEDTMEGIFDSIKNAALIHKSGGGTGFSFSRLRAKGATVNSTGGVASGPVSFMKVFNAATEAVKQGGTRRGANMGILRIDHPDIMEFITCKSDNSEITNFNISVGLTEKFIEAVENNRDYELVEPGTGTVTGTLNAGKVFDLVVEMAWKNGEPGIIFLDRINNENVTPEMGEIESTNPCGEQPLLPFEACNLGSVNLAGMVKNMGGKLDVDYGRIESTVRKAVRFLDNVIDVNAYPLPQIDERTRSTRKIGLGVMGWADMLCKLNIAYNSQQGVSLGEKVMGFIREKATQMSVELAEKKGVFPAYEKSIYKNKGIRLRNATTTTIAPTGTLSIIAGVSSGIEPLFAISYIRNIMDNEEFVEVNPLFKQIALIDGFYSEELMRRIAKNGTIKGLAEVPKSIQSVFVTAHDVSPEWHVKMQAAFQKQTDNAVSKTVNLPHDATLEDVREVFLSAYKQNCKGVTIYRDGSRDLQVLNIGSVKGKYGEKGTREETGKENCEETGKETPVEGGSDLALFHSGTAGETTVQYAVPYAVPGQVHPRPRPDICKGFTEKVKIGCGNLYITVNYDEQGICEVFTNTGRAGGCPSQSEATSRIVSIALRSGIDVLSIVEQLKGIRCPSTIRQKGLSVTSCPDAIGRVIEKVAQLQGLRPAPNIHAPALWEAEPAAKSAVSPVANPAVYATAERTLGEAFLAGSHFILEESRAEVPLGVGVGVRAVAASAGGSCIAESCSSSFCDADRGDGYSIQMSKCPECGTGVEHEGGCVVCRNCGFSKCG